MQRRHHPRFLGVPLPRVTLPQLPAALEAAAVVAAVVGFGLGWAWLNQPAQRAHSAYPDEAMTHEPESEASVEAAGATEVGVEVQEWLVDGFNLLHTALLGGEERSSWWTADGRGQVLEAVAGATLEGGRAYDASHPGPPSHPAPPIWVVFDGSRPAPAEDAGRLRSVFAPSADDWVVRRVKAAERPERMVVVTADRKLANRARHHGAAVLSPQEFLARQV